jgi:hypothetical protein
MKIQYIYYVKRNSDFKGDNQWVSMEGVMHLSKKMARLSAEHVNWVGAIDNIFTESVSIYCLVFSNETWDSEKIVDRLMEDALDPKSDDDWPTPFFYLLEKINSDRTKFVEKLKGGQLL